MKDSWLIYCAGGGHGHCMRAMALARSAIRKTERRIFLAGNRSAIRKVKECNSSERIQWIELDDRLSKSGFARQVQRTLDQTPYSRLIVDTFPRGIVGELGSLQKRLGLPTVFIHRDITPLYAESDPVRNAAASYDLTLVPGEASPLAGLPNAQKTAPWVLLDSEELLTAAKARKKLNCAHHDKPVGMVMLSGKSEERTLFSNLAYDLIRKTSKNCEIRICGDIPAKFESRLAGNRIDCWPAMRLLNGVDFLVGAGGYNTVHESICTETDLYAWPQKRLYDRQFRRVRKKFAFSSAAELIHGVLRRLSKPKYARKNHDQVKYTNGVHHAVSEIEAL